MGKSKWEPYFTNGLVFFFFDDKRNNENYGRPIDKNGFTCVIEM